MDYSTSSSCSEFVPEHSMEKYANNSQYQRSYASHPAITESSTVQSRQQNSLFPPDAKVHVTNSYRFSMANLEETHEAELDAILGELNVLEEKKTEVQTAVSSNGTQKQQTNDCGHYLPNPIMLHVANSMISSASTSSESANHSGSDSGGHVLASACGSSNGIVCAPLREPHRTESPDNDSAFSDTVSLLSIESTVSNTSSFSHQVHGNNHHKSQNLTLNLLPCDSAKAAKIHLALQKLEHASVRRLFLKAFTVDGASKSLLVDERMTCAKVTRMLAAKNHVTMEPHWALVEHLPDLQMERLYEDHELLVENLMNWRSDSMNRVIFVQRPDKVSLFNMPERYLNACDSTSASGITHDEHSRTMLLDEFFANRKPIHMEGALYLRADMKKSWKRHHFVLRASGLYYFPKDRTKSTKDMVCLALLKDYDVYHGIGWKKKHKAPTDHTFALWQSRESSRCYINPRQSVAEDLASFSKLLCADDGDTLERWIMAFRVAKYGHLLYDAQRSLVHDLKREELERCSVVQCTSIGSAAPSLSNNGSGSTSIKVSPLDNILHPSLVLSGESKNNSSCSSSSTNSGRLSRASSNSSTSSGCISDEALGSCGITNGSICSDDSIAIGFDTEFPNGTIKRKPSIKPNIPLTSMTRQLKEVGETMGTLYSDEVSSGANNAAGGGASSSIDQKHTARICIQAPIPLLNDNENRHSEETSSNSGTLKRRPTTKITSSLLITKSLSEGSRETSQNHCDKFNHINTQENVRIVQEPSNTINNYHCQHSILPMKQNNNSNNHFLNHHSSHVEYSISPHQEKPLLSPLEPMPECISDSMISLPPPPPPCQSHLFPNELEMHHRSPSLEAFPPPPPPCDLLHTTVDRPDWQATHFNPHTPTERIHTIVPMAAVEPVDDAIMADTTARSICEATVSGVTKPPRSTTVSIIKSAHIELTPTYEVDTISRKSYDIQKNSSDTVAGMKCVTFAGSPVSLQRKQVNFDNITSEKRTELRSRPLPFLCRTSTAPSTCELFVSSAPPPPPRAEATRLSSTLLTSHTSTKIHSDSQANPPTHFLEDLQRVMRKKWQVAQKCKLEPATMPHEVLGFRDFNGDLVLESNNSSSSAITGFYRETSNVSNWVNEHYGIGNDATADTSNDNNDSLYENNENNETHNSHMQMQTIAKSLTNRPPPPPPPKRSLSTQLSTQPMRSS